MAISEEQRREIMMNGGAGGLATINENVTRNNKQSRIFDHMTEVKQAQKLSIDQRVSFKLNLFI